VVPVVTMLAITVAPFAATADTLSLSLSRTWNERQQAASQEGAHEQLQRPPTRQATVGQPLGQLVEGVFLRDVFLLVGFLGQVFGCQSAPSGRNKPS
jgi:hypothetical protein